jgi:hypothetical protein
MPTTLRIALMHHQLYRLRADIRCLPWSTSMSMQTTSTTSELEVGESVTVTVEAQRFWNETGVHLMVGHEYRFSAADEWADAYITCDADGFPNPNIFLQISEWLRRAPRERWFALIGCVGRSPRAQFRIGKERILAAPASGELICFANDVSLAYWNNQGAVQLTVTRVS